MDNKRISIIIAAALIMLLVGISAISAADLNDSQVDASSLSDSAQAETPDLTANDDVTSYDNVKSDDTAKSNDDVKSDIDDKVKTQLKTTKKVDTENYVTDSGKSLKTAGSTITVTDGNYDKYFSDEQTHNINDNDTIILNGAFNNRTFFIDVPNLTITGNDATLTNGSHIYIGDLGENTTVCNLVINTTGVESAITIESVGSVITDNNITLTNLETRTWTINNNGDNTIIANNNVTAIGPSLSIDWDGGNQQGLAMTFSIFNQGGENVLIENNTVISTKHPDANSSSYGTVDGIEVQGGNNVTINNNTVFVTADRFVYGINVLENVNNTTISNNRIDVRSQRYIDGIQIGNLATNCLLSNNTITGTCYNDTEFNFGMGDDEACAFGIITTSMGGSSSSNITVVNNTIDMNSTIVYGMEIYSTKNATIAENDITLVGNYSMGMNLAHSANATISGNSFNTTGNSTIPFNPYFVEEIRPANTGIQVQQDSDNLVIENNVVIAADDGDNVKGVNVESSNNITVIDNQIKANNLTGNDAVTISANITDYNVSGNVQPEVKNDAVVNLEVPSTLQTGTNLEIKATVTDKETNQPINGKIVFKFNGSTLKDADNNPIILDVENGVVTYNYTLSGFSGKAYTLTAVFSNSSYNRAEGYANFTVTKANVAYPAVNYTSYSGSKLALNQIVYDENGNQLSGTTKVAIKIDGKTIGTAYIVNGVLSTTIDIPANYRAGTHTLSIVLGENNRYNSLRINSTITLLTQNAIITVAHVTAKPGELVTLTATLIGNSSQAPIIGGNAVFKINGKTVNNTDTETNVEGSAKQQVSNGTVSVNTYLPLSADEGTYAITVVFSGNNNVNALRYTDDTALTVKY